MSGRPYALSANETTRRIVPALWCRASIPSSPPAGARITHSSFVRSPVESSVPHQSALRLWTRPCSWPASTFSSPGDELGALGQRQLDLERPHGLSLDRLFGHVRRQPARVLQNEAHLVR